ncbi:cdp-alcohol phosphatidyltransferase protein [Pochonia chlamydosporia 170]|uniref:Cdp-alcohol phosphatidyltransferase protein n=1 Tax=Pochonia chlamydosporia 170 TaxID=1380566 RepID=A0A179FBC7_METCM|nr:cdp-alcohol phosphatidyltransferase protein [Pochonia chlamydosporia 170]OAQ62610.1 cdp-alcohol phosphatidyltransferase protein [Pochonia chlamydosporia 170]
MLSLRNTFLAVAACVSTVVNADYTIDPESVPITTRKAWCQQEMTTCPLICQQVEPRTTLVNTCDPESLTYGCLCGNNMQPNVSEYSLSLPYFICTQWVIQCKDACSTDACKSDCQQKHPCGAQSPSPPNKTKTATTSSSSTSAPNTIYTDGPGGSGNSGKKGAGVALEVGRTYGLAIVLTGLFAGFALL